VLPHVRPAMPRRVSYVLWEIETAKIFAGEGDGHDGSGIGGAQRARRLSGLARGATREEVVCWYRVCLSRYPQKRSSFSTVYPPRATPGASEHACPRLPDGMAPEEHRPSEHKRVSLNCGTTYARNEDKRLRAANNVAPVVAKTQIKKREEIRGLSKRLSQAAGTSHWTVWGSTALTARHYRSSLAGTGRPLMRVSDANSEAIRKRATWHVTFESG